MTQKAWEPTTFPDAYERAPDEKLVRRFQAGDSSVFEVLYQRYCSSLYKFSVSLVGKDNAEDLVQDVFSRVYQKLPRMQEELRDFKAWLYQVTKNAAHDFLRHTKPLQWLPWKEHKELRDSDCVSVVGLEWMAEEANLIQYWMAQITPKYRPCLYLAIFEEMRQREIAKLLDIPERTVRRYICEGKKQLRLVYESFEHEQRKM